MGGIGLALIVLGILWTATCIFAHGPYILIYVALHAVTTGVFMAFIQKADPTKR